MLNGQAAVAPITLGKFKGGKKSSLAISSQVSSDSYETLYQRTITPTVITQTGSPGATVKSDVSPTASGTSAFGLDGKNALILGGIAFALIWFLRK